MQVTDLLPAGVTFVSASPSQGSYDDVSGLWDVGSVTPGTPQTLDIVATVVSSAAQTNTATITDADQFDPNTGPDSDVATETPQHADPALTKSVNDATPNVGGQITFLVTLSNGGPDAATGVRVTDLLPAGLTFVSDQPSQGVYTPGSGVWDVGTVTPGTPQTLAIVASSPSSSSDAAVDQHGVGQPWHRPSSTRTRPTTAAAPPRRRSRPTWSSPRRSATPLPTSATSSPSRSPSRTTARTRPPASR